MYRHPPSVEIGDKKKSTYPLISVYKINLRWISPMGYAIVQNISLGHVALYCNILVIDKGERKPLCLHSDLCHSEVKQLKSECIQSVILIASFMSEALQDKGTFSLSFLDQHSRSSIALGEIS